MILQSTLKQTIFKVNIQGPEKLKSFYYKKTEDNFGLKRKVVTDFIDFISSTIK